MQTFQYRNPRFQVNIPLDVYVVSGSHLRGRCVDISVEGMRAELEQQIPVGTTVRLELSVDGNSVTLAARLAYHEQKRCGLVFQFSSEHERSLMSKLLQAVQKSPGRLQGEGEALERRSALPSLFHPLKGERGV
jgi:hypothetical protein